MKNRKRWSIIILLFVMLPVLFCAMDIFFRIQRREFDIDLHSGRMRKTYRLVGIPLHWTTWDTDLSRTLAPEDRVTGPPDWRRVDTFLTGLSGLHSEDFREIHVMDFKMIWDMGSFTPEARRQSARTILRLMHVSGNAHNAFKYYQALDELAVEALDKEKPVQAKDLPQPATPDHARMEYRQSTE